LPKAHDEYNDADAACGLACLAITEGQWRTGAEKAVRALLLKSTLTIGDYGLVQNLGRCLTRLDNRELPGIAELVKHASGSPVADLVMTVAAFALHSRSPEAAQLLKSGLVDEARSAASDSLIFTQAVVLQERTKELERARRSAVSSLPNSFRGHITAFYAYGNFGFIFEEQRCRRAF
jgi:hypothetical protein